MKISSFLAGGALAAIAIASAMAWEVAEPPVTIRGFVTQNRATGVMKGHEVILSAPMDDASEWKPDFHPATTDIAFPPIPEKSGKSGKVKEKVSESRAKRAAPANEFLEAARVAASKTGIRAELIIAVLHRETSLGKNVGRGNWLEDMSPAERPIFARIARKLGKDPDRLPVSRRPVRYSGWGGAMGHAQALPSTWEKLAPQIAKATGHAMPNPWNKEDAVMFAALLLKQNGALKDERKAIARYIGGVGGPRNEEIGYYVRDVLALAGEYGEKYN